MNINQSKYNYQNNSFKASALKVSKRNFEFLLRQGKSYNEIAKIYEKPVEWVAQIISNYNIRNINPITKGSISEIIDKMTQEGATLLEIQENTGLSVNRIKVLIYANRVKKSAKDTRIYTPKLKQENNTNTIMSEKSQILEFREGFSLQELAEKYKINPITIKSYLASIKNEDI